MVLIWVCAQVQRVQPVARGVHAVAGGARPADELHAAAGRGAGRGAAALAPRLPRAAVDAALLSLPRA